MKQLHHLSSKEEGSLNCLSVLIKLIQNSNKGQSPRKHPPPSGFSSQLTACKRQGEVSYFTGMLFSPPSCALCTCFKPCWVPHSLCFKLVGCEDVRQRHYFLLVNRQQVLRNILKQTEKSSYLISQVSHPPATALLSVFQRCAGNDATLTITPWSPMTGSHTVEQKTLH